MQKILLRYSTNKKNPLVYSMPTFTPLTNNCPIWGQTRIELRNKDQGQDEQPSL